MDGLSDMERAFVEAYTGPGSGVHAATLAGYTGSRAVLAVRANKLLRRPRVRAALEARGHRIEGPAPKPVPSKPKAPKPRPTPPAEVVASPIPPMPAPTPPEPPPAPVQAPPPPPAAAYDEASLGDDTPLDVLRAIMTDQNALASSRVRAAELLQRAAERAAAAQHDADPHGTLRTLVQGLIRKKRERERAEGAGRKR